MTFSKYLLDKKITKEAHRHHLMKKDLKNAVEAIRLQEAELYVEARMYMDGIKFYSNELMEVAGDVVQFCKDAGEYIGG